MSRFSFTVFLFGLSSFFFDFSYGLGWLSGWIFILLLEYNREKFLNSVLDLENFLLRKYIAYLLGVTLWLVVPLLISAIFPDFLNPFAVFAAYLANRIIMFVSNAFVKEER